MKTRKNERRKWAMHLLAVRAGRTDQQQLAHLDKLLGKGIGAKRERARLNARINKAAK